MSSNNLDNLVKVGHLKLEPVDKAEFKGLVQSGKARLQDAANENLCAESRFDLAYNAAHALAIAALRDTGYRAANRYIVFQALPMTADLGPEVWRVLAMCHDKRNAAEYEGYWEVDERLLNDLIAATKILLKRIEKIM